MRNFKVDAELEIKAYYAGHVLGAAMFQVRYTEGLQETYIILVNYLNLAPPPHPTDTDYCFKYISF